jgi:HD-GYP domain-containing protein (c-di-GMP phosphodiesterase class II)
LSGDRIPIGARILAVADALEAMSSPRSYKAAFGLDQVRRELTAGAGHQFDPAVAQETLNWLDEVPDVIRTT